MIQLKNLCIPCSSIFVVSCLVTKHGSHAHKKLPLCSMNFSDNSGTCVSIGLELTS